MYIFKNIVMIKMQFGKFEFDGLRIKRYEKYPWATPEERKTFFGKLQEDGTHYSKERWIRFSEKEAAELIHVNMSKSYILKALSIFCILVIALSGTVGTLIFGFIGLFSLLFSYFFKNMARQNWINLQMDYFMSNILF